MKDEIQKNNWKNGYKYYGKENNKNEIEIIFINNEGKYYPIKMNANKEEAIDKKNNIF